MGYAIKQKIDICLMAESNPTMTQQDLALWAQQRYGSSKPPSQTTISRILAKKDELISLKEHEFKLIRRRRLSNPLLRKVLLEWISQCVWNNIPMTAPIIISSAGNFWKQLPENMREGTGEFSYKWCSQFLSKVNINLNNIERELYNRLKIWTFEERSQLKQLLSGFDPKKIFTLSEVFISHDLPLDKSYYNDSSDFMTCMLCVNCDGSEKLDPFIIGRYENYPSFEGKSSIKAATKHGVTYHSNRKKWLTSTLFYDWLSVLDKRLALVNRDIVLILDDSASHRIINIKLQRIRLLYTSSTSNFLPMNWGIENEFRLNFRIDQYKSLIERQIIHNNKVLNKEEQSFNTAETFDLIKGAWNKVPIKCIQSAWKKSGILPEEITQRYPKRKIFDNDLEIELLTLINQFEVKERWDVLSLLDLSIEKKTNNSFLSIAETIQSCIVDSYEDFNHDGIPKRAPFSHTLGQGFPKLQRLGERLNSYSGINIKFSPSDFDFDFTDHLDEHLPDADEDLAYPTVVNQDNGLNGDSFNARELQPMSELAPLTYERTDFEPWNNWNNIFTDHQTPDRSSAASTSLSNWEFQGISPLMNGPPSYQLPSESEYKLVIIDNFLKLIEQDGSLSLSDVSTNEIMLLRERVLRSMAN